MTEINKLTNVIFDENDIRPCHCDLNPVNILFDGEKYFFVDWQAASPQSFYFDLAYCANWVYFYNEEFCDLFLSYYLGREATEAEKAKYYLMRIFTYIYLGIGFISIPCKENRNYRILSDENIKKLPAYLDFMRAIGSGMVDLKKADVQEKFGFIFLKTAMKMMDKRYKQTYDFLLTR